ncbi:MAG: G-D-S-L family lipolytic protein [Chitinophagaceae bacterium]|nr:G-D-S-L family lipolytic protein [Chitinophagaceae bacterium]
MMRKIKYLFIVFFLASVTVKAQDKIPFWKEVQALKQQDSLKFPAANQVLLIGSSSFTLWKDVQEYFPKHKILNRAFGGSTLVDLIRFRYDVIYPYQPKQIVIYCGENDFASSDTITVEMVMQRFKTLYNLIRAKYASVPLLYVSMKPSPSRAHLMPKYKEANKQIALFLKGNKKNAFADVYHAMLKPDGSPMDDIFIQDELHMNARGYAIWKKVLEKYLIK